MLGVLLAALLASATGLGWTLHLRDQARRDQGNSLVYLPPPWIARHGSFGHPQLLADYVWLQALQYYGDEANRAQRYRDLHRYLELVVELDPDFRYAYRFGAAAIPYNTGGWTWHNVEHSTALIQRGLARFPDDWQLWLQLGFNRGVLGTDYEGAAEAYRHAASARGAPTWIPQLVTRLYSTAGSLERARAYALEILENTDQPELQETMRQRLKEIAAEESLIQIDQAIRRFREQTGEAPSTLTQLFANGLLTSLPQDPLGGTFYIENGEARSTSMEGGRLRVFGAEPQHEAIP